MKNLAVILLLGVFAGGIWSVNAAETLKIKETLEEQILDDALAGGAPDLMLLRLMTAEMTECGKKIQAAQEGLTTQEKLAAWQQRTRQACLDSLGGFPERTPLNARITEKIKRDGYRIEKVLFESRPHFYVTAYLFLPDQARFNPPYPGIVIACGHSKNGKGYAGYQRGALMAAFNGMAALIFDPIDQGERLQGIGSGSCSGHNITGVKAALLGWNTATFRIWDGMRAIDYLAARPEVDPSRIGCMGNSGGGTLSTYISALDKRVKAAAPSCYISSLQEVCAAMGPQDAEQNLFGQMAFGLEHSGWLLLRAPNPTCVCAAQKDMFPIAGTYQSLKEVRSVYANLNASEKIELVEYDGPHGWAEPLKVGAVTFMSKWLRKSSDVSFPPLTENGLKAEDENVTEHGQVMKLEGARSVYDLMRDEAARLEQVRKLNLRQRNLQSAVRSRAGIRALTDIPTPLTINRSTKSEKGVTIRRVVLSSEGRVAVPALFFMPDSPQGVPALVINGNGKKESADSVAALLEKGQPVLAADLSGFGETYGAKHKFYGAANKDEGPGVMAYLLGHSLVGIRAEDTLICARWLSIACGASQVQLRAKSWAVTPALHAAVAEPQLFASLSLSDEPPTWEEVVVKDISHRFTDIVHGALQEYTIGDLKGQF